MKKVLISLDEFLGCVFKAIKIDYAGFTDTSLDSEETENNLTKWFSSQPPAPQWVRVEDGLPPVEYREDEPDVRKNCIINIKLTANKYSRNQIAEGWYDYGLHTWALFDFNKLTPYQASVGDSFDLDITHWMPIPALPEAQE